MTMLQFICLIVGLYILGEVVATCTELDGHKHPFLSLRYLLVTYVGGSLIMYTYTWDKLSYAFVVACFLMPRTLYRLKLLKTKRG